MSTKPMTRAEMIVWGTAYEKSLASGDDHGWAANAGDNAVERFRTKQRKIQKSRQAATGGSNP